MDDEEVQSPVLRRSVTEAMKLARIALEDESVLSIEVAVQRMSHVINTLRMQRIDSVQLVDRHVVWHEREARACRTNIAGLQGRGMAPHRTLNEGALKVHLITVQHLQQIRSALDGSATEPTSELRDCTCDDVRRSSTGCRGVGSLGDGWRCVKLGRGPTPEERAEVKRQLDEYAAKMTDHTSFIERCLRGEIDSPHSEIDDAVSAWHEGSSGQKLHEYLGMTWDEYSAWVLSPESLTVILEERRQKG